MGSVWAKIWGKRSTRDELASISEKLSSIEEFKRNTQALQKKVVSSLVLYFSAFYLIAALFAYFKFYLDPRWQGSRMQLVAPFAIAPVVAWATKRMVTWWYRLRLRKNEVKMEKLLLAKGKLLEEVMEKETYKVAKELIDKYGGADQQIRQLRPAASTATPQARFPAATITSDLRRRNTLQPSATAPAAAQQQQSFSRSPTPQAAAEKPFTSSDYSSAPRRSLTTGGGPPLPRPVLPRERGYMDRVVEYLVGDGPSNRYALVCKQCQSHNGMALREEFEYISYRCCYCFYWNPARKQRPSAPLLPTEAERRKAGAPSDTSSTSDEETTAKARPRALQAAEESSTPRKAQSNDAHETEYMAPPPEEGGAAKEAISGATVETPSEISN